MVAALSPYSTIERERDDQRTRRGVSRSVLRTLRELHHGTSRRRRHVPAERRPVSLVPIEQLEQLRISGARGTRQADRRRGDRSRPGRTLRDLHVLRPRLPKAQPRSVRSSVANRTLSTQWIAVSVPRLLGPRQSENELQNRLSPHRTVGQE